MFEKEELQNIKNLGEEVLGDIVISIEQVQKLLGHVKIDTTMHYAIVNQNNVKIAHRKYLG